jgi:glutathione S-transferase
VKLYYSPGACSLASHIALHEGDVAFDRIKVDLKAKTTEGGEAFEAVNPKGYVPALAFDDGQVLTENVAILRWISDRGGLAVPDGDLGPYRLLEMLAFISTEVHKGFKPFFSQDASDADKARAAETIGKRLDYLARGLRGDFLFGSRFSAADAYLFVMLLWAGKNGLSIPAPLQAFFDRMKARPAVALALTHEGLA